MNHLTAARVYRRLAELGYVTASVGRGTFVRTLAPGRQRGAGDDWQLYALPERELTYSEQVLADGFTLGRGRGRALARDRLAGAEHLSDHELAAITAEVFEEEGGDALSYLPAEGLYELREQLAARGREHGFAAGRRTRSSSPPAPSRRSASPRARRSSRATSRSSSRRPSPACWTRCARPARA